MELLSINLVPFNAMVTKRYWSRYPYFYFENYLIEMIYKLYN